MSLFFQPDDIADRARSNGRTVFEQIKTEHRKRKASLCLARQAQNERMRERIAREEREKAEAEERSRQQAVEAEERAKRERWRRSWARMINIARRQHYAHRDIRDFAHPREIVVTSQIKEIVKEVSELTGVSVDEIKSNRRSKHIVRARFLIWWRARHETFYSLPEIGRRTGGKDHTTVLSGIRKFESALRSREKWAVMLAGAKG